MTNQFHEANGRRWDAGSASWAHRADTRGIWKKCHLDPSLALHLAELEWLRDIAGKKAAVLGSGDNQVVFALAGLGANVTSIDISEPQIETARSRAAALGLQVDFVRADVVDLSTHCAAALPTPCAMENANRSVQCARKRLLRGMRVLAHEDYDAASAAGRSITRENPDVTCPSLVLGSREPLLATLKSVAVL